MPAVSNPRSFILTLFVFSFLPLAGSAGLFFIVSENPVFFETLSPPGIALVFLISVFTMALALTPSTFIAFVSGYLFSWAGFPLMILAYLGASAAGRLIGKFISGGLKEQWIGKHEKWKNFVSAMEKRSFMLVVFARLSPVMPFAMVNIALAAMDLKKQIYFSGTLVGMLPRTFLSFWLGIHAVAILAFFKNPKPEGMINLIPIALVGVSVAGILFIANKSWREAQEKK